MNCSRCGSTIATGSLFCDTCGASQAATRERRSDGTFQVGEPVRLSPPEHVGAAAVARVSVLAVASLVIGVLSVCTMSCLGFVFLVLGPLVGVPPALAGIITGHMALGRINHSSGGLTGTAAAIFGLVLNYLTLFAGLGVTAVWLVLGKLVFG